MISPLSDMTVTCPFGWRVHPITKRRQYHNGVDLRAPLGTPVRAPFTGVCSLSTHPTGGKQLILRHQNGLRAGFAHLSDYASGVHDGSVVKEGQVIAYTGETGKVTGPHLHYTLAVEQGGGRQFFNPQIVLYS